MEIIGTIIALIKAIPIIDGWFQALAAAYVSASISQMKSENLAAIKKAIADHDQRALERAIGNPHAGENSGHGEIRDHLPGVNN